MTKIDSTLPGLDSGSDSTVESRPLRPSRRRRYRLWVSVIVVLAALGFVVVKGLGSALVYFKTVDQAVADKAQLGDQTFRVFGTVVPGSLTETGKSEQFRLSNNNVSISVINQGVPPQLFGAGVPVVLDGHFAGALFDSDQILIKHSQVYVAAHPDRFKKFAPNPKGTKTSQ